MVVTAHKSLLVTLEITLRKLNSHIFQEESNGEFQVREKAVILPYPKHGCGHKKTLLHLVVLQQAA